MIVTRSLVPVGSCSRVVASFSINRNSLERHSRSYHVQPLSKNLCLVTATPPPTPPPTPSTLSTSRQGRPLAIILPWLLSKQAHVLKYAAFYLEQGCDVLTARITPRHLLWPRAGSQVVAGELLGFLEKNYQQEALMLHGFSVGGYFWGEVCGKVLANPEQYQPILDRIVGQVWDSVADINEVPIGVSRAVFPNSPALQALAHKYLKYHMRAFHDLATCHYIRSSQMFHTNLVKAPALFLVSKTDPVGSEVSNRRVHDSWASRGVKTYWKCWEESPHVGHYRKYPKEYAAELFAFLDRLRLVQNPEKMRAKM